VFREIKIQDFDASQYDTEQVFYESKDGTKIPMFIVHKRVSNIILMLAEPELNDPQLHMILYSVIHFCYLSCCVKY
jgi:Serine proteases of the peptidase family S9A